MKDNFKTVQQVCNKHGFILDETEEYISNMKTAKEYIHFHCMSHENEQKYLPYCTIKSGRCSCSQCTKEYGKKSYTIDEKKSMIKQHELEYISGDLNNVGNPITVKCKQGHIFKRSFHYICNGSDECPECKGIIPTSHWTIETCQNWIDENMSGYTILDRDYVDNRVRVKVKCPVEGHSEYWTSWNHLYKDKTICRECYYVKENKVNWNKDNANEYIKSFGYELLYPDKPLDTSHERVAIKDKLGFIYMTYIHFFVRGRRKFSLWRNNPYAVHNIKLFCKLYRPDYEFMDSEYHGANHMYEWKYIGECIPDEVSRVFKQTLESFVKAGCGHPFLSKSSLEAKCQLILNKYNVSYEEQKTFDKCKYRISLRFDYYIVKDGKEYCIETDGDQHNHPVEMFGGEEGFLERKRRDEIKNEFCENNGITLIRIPQKHMKFMEDIIVRELGLQKID